MTGYPASFVSYCHALSLRLTSLRKAVLFTLWQAQKPLKAYDILQCLISFCSNATATSVYRALDFFMASGVLHKIESIQAYTLCLSPAVCHSTEMLMVCRRCHQVSEQHDEGVRVLLSELALSAGFELDDHALELKGICQLCALTDD